MGGCVTINQVFRVLYGNPMENALTPQSPPLQLILDIVDLSKYWSSDTAMDTAVANPPLYGGTRAYLIS
jgi:hypothetical protein